LYPEEPASEFQEFIESSTGQQLRMFGYDLFKRVPSTFAPVDRIPVTADYTIGPGDEILLRGWGQVDIDYRVIVDRVGNIFIPKVGNISVSGVKYGQLQPYLKSAVERVFHNFELNVTLGQLRSIQVFIVGQARHPGSYTVSSLSTLVNAVFASGGPSQRGSMRRIQLKRDNKVVTEFDLYDLLLNGDKSKDVSLHAGDVIFIPAIGPVVGIVGSVNAPAIYELKEQSSLGEVIQLSGGLTPTAVGQKATVERITGRSVRSIDEFMLDDGGMNRLLREGDLITIRPLSARFDNAITLRGNVAVPGRYPWREGMRIRDLIPSRESLLTRNFWLKQSDLGRGIVSRVGEPQSSRKQTGDSLENRRASEFQTSLYPNRLVQGRPVEQNSTRELYDNRDSQEQHDGNRQKNGAYSEVEEEFGKSNSQDASSDESKGDSKLRNDIKRTSPEINWDYAVIQRFDREQLSTKLVPFNLGKALLNTEDSNNLVLQPGDVITIFSQADIKVPQVKQSKFVRLEGEFHNGGVYELEHAETLRHLIARVGGLTPQAYLFGAEFTRESTREVQQKRMNEFLLSLERDVELTGASRSQNVASPEEALGLKEKIESQRKLVDKLRQVKATGRLILDLKPSVRELTEIPDIILEDGDHFTVPYRPATVNVVGAVYNETSILYKQNRDLSAYLQQAGGGTRLADKSRTFVVRADGVIIAKSKSSGWFNSGFDKLKLMPGDTIVVPQQIDKVTLLKGLKDWSLVIGNFALGAAAIKTLTRP
jgi:protein involved in polysaccharide export with SLBB domain